MSALEKSPDAFRTISEVADDLDVPQHVLRFWESKFAQVKPLKRAGGRRYYRPEDIDLLRGIRTLLYSDGFTIKGVQRVFREQGLRYVIETGRMAARADQEEIEERPLPVSRSHSGTASGAVVNPALEVEAEPESATVADVQVAEDARPSDDLSPRQRAALSSILDELEDLRSQLNNARGRAVRVAKTSPNHEMA